MVTLFSTELRETQSSSRNYLRINLLRYHTIQTQTIFPKILRTLRGLGSDLMKIIYWNWQGLAKPKAVRALRQLLKESSPDILFLCELKTSLSPSISNALLSSSLTNSFVVPPIGFSGGLLLAWNNAFTLTITSHSTFFINTLVHTDPSSPSWQFTSIYLMGIGHVYAAENKIFMRIKRI
ncbi:hypothetical protein ACP275_12G017100 [Erythranthe tilingii]